MSIKNEFTRVFDILAYQLARYPQQNAVNTFNNNKWQHVSTAKLLERTATVACWVLAQGYKKGDKIGIIPRHGSLDWLIIDFACQQIGIIIIPLHASSSREELAFILSETYPVLLIVADNELHENFRGLHANDKEIPILSLSSDNEHTFQAAHLYEPVESEREKLTNIKNSIEPDDILTIMYTSGTSGEPKGAILTHKNMVSNILFSLAAFPLQASLKVMSYLPFSHILERSACYAYLACGASIYFVRSRDTFLADFQSARPYFSTSVPRVLEKMYAYLQEKSLDQNWLVRKLTNWAIKTAQEYSKKRRNGIILTVKIFLARILVLNKWKNQLGGKLKCMVVGAASLNPEIARMFSAAGIRIREGYGMTEASPLISLNRFSPGLNRFGTVGIPVPAMDLRIDEENEHGEGEIWIKGPNVMQGYYKRPELNKEVFTIDGWFKTGDVGKLIDGRFLQITDRKKDIFKTSAGKYIAPQPLENKLKSSPYILQSLVIGFGRPFVTALIVPNFHLLEEWCVSEDIHWTSPQYMVHNIKVNEKIEQEVTQINQNLSNFQQIKAFVLCAEEWTTENKLLTTTLKPIRQSLLKLNEKDLNKIYS
jgi:long-chain acyl-CoA synthetase